MSAPTGFEVVPNLASNRDVIQKLPVLVLMTHSRCNCRCVMCDIWKSSDGRELTFEDLRSHLQAIRDLQVSWVVFSGGEPLMNRGLFPLARALREMGIRLTLLSTGLLLSKYAAEIAANIDEVIVSLDGPPEVHDAIRRVPRAYDRMAEGICLLSELAPNLPIRARTTVQAANHQHLRATVVAAKSLGLRSISFLAADVTSSAFNRELVWPGERQNEITLDSAQVDALEEEIAALSFEFADAFASGFLVESPAKFKRIVAHFRAHLGLEPATAPVCNAPWVSAVVEVDGSVRPCFFHRSIGNLREANFAEVLNSDEAIRFRNELDINSNSTCQRCVCSLHYSEATAPERTPGS